MKCCLLLLQKEHAFAGAKADIGAANVRAKRAAGCGIRSIRTTLAAERGNRVGSRFPERQGRRSLPEAEIGAASVAGEAMQCCIESGRRGQIVTEYQPPDCCQLDCALQHDASCFRHPQAMDRLK